ncbi:MAG: M28 family peptidase [Bacteroidetes bacterium]|nr:MAG: M28 family peptidase [Bacteroidota bacterium]
MTNFRFLIIALFLSMTIFSCKEKTDEKSIASQLAKPELVLQKAPVFNPDSAYFFIEKQVSFGTRVPNTATHDQCGAYLVQTLKNLGLEVTEQNFEAEAYNKVMLKSKNIIGTYKPEASKRILLAAHWDTRPFADQDDERKTEPILGANDGASGVGVILEVLRTIQADKQLNIGVDVIFLDSEDYGQPENTGEHQDDSWCLGAQYWAKNRHKANYSAYFGILLDMVGTQNAKFYKEGTSRNFAPTVTDKIWEIGEKLGYSDFFIQKNSGGITDDHLYINKIAGIPTVDIIDHDPNSMSYFNQYWHTHDDNMKIIDKKTLKAVGQTVLQVLYNEQNTVN